MTPKQFDVLRETMLTCTENGFWLFMAIQSTIFNSENTFIIQSCINNFANQWTNLFGRYYSQNDANIFKVNVSNFFDTYISYLNTIKGGKDSNCTQLLDQWKHLGDVLSQNFASVNPYWQEREWRAMISNQVDILNREIKNNVEGVYSTLTSSYSIYSRVANDIAGYVATGLIKQFSI